MENNISLFKKVSKIKDDNIKKLKELWKDISYLKSTFIISFVIYTIAFFALIMANYNYGDDMGRVSEGYRVWTNFSRYTSEYLSAIIHTSTYLADISPLTKIIAISLLSLSNCIIIHLFSEEKKNSFSKIMSALSIGLFPAFLCCMSYKFDSPYMALSIFSMVVPFIFLKYSDKAYLLISILGTIIMCTSYQAASGIYPTIVIFLALKYWNKKEKDIKEIVRFIIISAISFIIGLCIFKFFIMQPIPDYNDYAGNELLPINMMLSGIVKNLKQYYILLKENFRTIWLLLIIIISIGFVFENVLHSKQKKIISIVLHIIAIIFAYILAFGLYIVFEKPLIALRSMYGMGILIAILSVQCCNNKNYILKGICISLAWCFIAFSSAYGTALAEQKRYADFRIQAIIYDLNDLDVMNTDNIKTIQFTGFIGKSPIVRNMSNRYNILNYIVPDTLAHWDAWTEVYFGKFFDIKNIQYDTSVDMKELELPVLKDTMYHKISGNNEYIHIELK